MSRFIARLLVAALKSTAVQNAAREVSDYIARRGTAFVLRKLRASSKIYND